jgi:hypothetical protein
MTFTPSLVFDRNAHTVPMLVRLVDIIWSLNALGSINPYSSIKIPTSAYSLSMTLLIKSNFHDPGPEAVRITSSRTI